MMYMADATWKCKKILLKKYENIMPRVRLELTAFRLWDWRAAYCATEAVEVIEKFEI